MVLLFCAFVHNETPFSPPPSRLPCRDCLPSVTSAGWSGFISFLFLLSLVGMTRTVHRSFSPFPFFPFFPCKAGRLVIGVVDHLVDHVSCSFFFPRSTMQGRLAPPGVFPFFFPPPGTVVGFLECGFGPWPYSLRTVSTM